MSIKLMAMVFDIDGQLTPTEKLVMLSMSDHAGDDGYHVYPGNAAVMRRTGLKETAARDTVNELTRIGLLITVKEATPNSPAERRINVEMLRGLVEGTVTITRAAPKPKKGGSSNEEGVPPNGTGEYRQTVQGVPPADTDGTAKRYREYRQTVQGVPPNEPESLINHDLTISKQGDAPANAPPSLVEVWKMIRSQIEWEMSRGLFRHYFEPLQLAALEDGVLRLRAPDKDRAAWVESRLGTRISKLVGPLLNQEVRVEVVV